MVTKWTRWSLAACLAFSIGLPVLRAEISVHLEPDEDSPRIAGLDPAQVSLVDAFPVMDDAKAAQGWMFTEYFGTFVGFVDPDTVTKGLGVVPNTPAFLRPDRASPVLALLREGDRVDVVRVGADWAEVEFEKLIPVYFRLGEEIADEPIPVPPVDRRADRQEVIEELEPIRTLPDPSVQVPDRPRVPRAAPATDVARRIEGRLIRASRFFGFKPKHTFELRSADNKRLGWVDLSEVLVSSLTPYLDQEVVLYGEIVPIEDSQEFLIKARTVQLR